MREIVPPTVTTSGLSIPEAAARLSRHRANVLPRHAAPAVGRRLGAQSGHDDRVVRSVELGRGRRLVVRHAGVDDVDAVQALYERLSPEDLQLRFFVAHAPSTNFLEQWLSVEDRGGVSLVAEVEDPGAAPTTKVVGEAGYAPLPDGDAEFGITVDPEWRGWLGPWLLDTLAEQGAARGVPNLQANVLLRNRKMLALLRHRGYAVIDHPDWSEVRLVIGTTGRTPSWPPKPSGPRILVEAPGGRWSGESTAREHGFDVRTCPGPDGPTPHCPLLEGRPCPLVEGADALVVALPPDDPRTDQLIAAHRERHPELMILLPARPEGSSPGHPCETAAEVVARLHAALDDQTPEGD